MTESSPRYRHVCDFVANACWAILPSKLAEIMAFLSTKAAGEMVDAEIVAEYQAAASSRTKPRSAGGVGVLPVHGTITHRVNLMNEMSGGASVEGLMRDFRAMIKDPDIRAVVLDINSPGGTVDGITELASEIYASRRTKPVTAVANTLMASASYWLASAASEVAVTPSALVGSIGVIAAHENQAGLYEKLGVDVSLVTAGKYKGEGNPFEPLSDDARAEIQRRVDDYYAMFTRDVAKGRGVAVESVRAGMAEGRVVGAREAIKLGMADRMATLDEVIATIGQSQQDAAEPDMPMAAMDVYARVKIDTDYVQLLPASQTFEDQCSTALTAVTALHTRVRALTALRVQDGRLPLSKHNIPTIREMSDALTAIATDLDGLLAIAMPPDNTRVAAIRQARSRLYDLDLWLIEH